MQTESVARVSKEQIRMIHVLKAKLQIPDRAYRSMLRDYKVFSSVQLTANGASQFIWDLQKVAESKGVWQRPARKYQELAGRRNMATPKQLRMIEAIWRDVSHASNMAERVIALNSFLGRFGASSLESMEYWQVSKIVSALNAMKGATA